MTGITWIRHGAWLVMARRGAFTAWHMGDPGGCRVADSDSWPGLLRLMTLAERLALTDLSTPRPGLAAYLPERPVKGLSP
ncbi:hypothetical protein [Thermoactinospora rubra]|uniref:hypothetical protein n=1 Tax=Thermoactinospora rubra TaxID=1088767 RepID=UPI000A117BB3|nr:hypothetical protein [Thermoactinospora rubra]